MQIAIVDYGMGNLGSLEAMAERLGFDAVRWASGRLPAGTDWVILPGVGSLAHAVEELKARRLIEPLNDAFRREVPILGICLGLQLLFDWGEEGGEGLGWIRGDVPYLGTPVTPHMGWNTVETARPSPLFAPGEVSAFYFVHSYYARPFTADAVVGTTTYSGVTFASVVQSGRVVGAQFHPELSGAAGRDFIRRFREAVAV